METFGSAPIHRLTVGKPDYVGAFAWEGVCDCHNPDGWGDGGMYWVGESPQEVYDFWYDHYVDVTVFADDVLVVPL